MRKHGKARNLRPRNRIFPQQYKWVIWVAERQGFEPWRRFPAYTLSRRAPSTTRPPLRWTRFCRVTLNIATRQEVARLSGGKPARPCPVGTNPAGSLGRTIERKPHDRSARAPHLHSPHPDECRRIRPRAVARGTAKPQSRLLRRAAGRAAPALHDGDIEQGAAVPTAVGASVAISQLGGRGAADRATARGRTRAARSASSSPISVPARLPKRS